MLINEPLVVGFHGFELTVNHGEIVRTLAEFVA